MCILFANGAAAGPAGTWGPRSVILLLSRINSKVIFSEEILYFSKIDFGAEQSVESALRNTGAFQAGVLGREFPVLAGKSSPVMETYLQGITYTIAAAKHALGGLYAQGLGVRRDDVKAFMWFQLAADQGESDAAYNRDWLAERMTSAQIAEAQRLVREWRPKD